MENIAMFKLPLREKEDDPQLTLVDFEKGYQLNLIQWLVREKYCLPHQAKAMSATILEQLKQRYSDKKTYRLSLIWQIIHKFTLPELSKVRKSMEKNFGLTELGFQELLENLQKGEDALVEQLFLSHFEDCMQYLQRNYRASHEDAYDATMETMLEFIKRLKANKVSYGNLRFLFTQMAGQVYLKWIKKERPKSTLEGLDIGEAPPSLDMETLQVLDKAWEGLCDQCRDLLKKFYYDGIALKTMAELLDKTPAALRKQKQRCVEKLRGLFVRQL